LPLGGLVSVQPSPAGRQLLVSDAQYSGLVVVDVKTGRQVAISDAPRAGFRAGWIDETHVARRVPQAPFGGQPRVAIDVGSGEVVGPAFEHPTLLVKQDDDTGTVVLGRRLDETGAVSGARVLSPVGETCFAPQLAGRTEDVVVAFQCLGSGVWLARVAGKDGRGAVVHARLGDGAQLALARDGRTATFSVMQDEGHVVTASDIVVVDLDGWEGARAPKAMRLTSTRIERAPGASDVRSDGSRVLAFLVDEGDVILVDWRGGR
jgi:hypothetical protein